MINPAIISNTDVTKWAYNVVSTRCIDQKKNDNNKNNNGQELLLAPMADMVRFYVIFVLFWLSLFFSFYFPKEKGSTVNGTFPHQPDFFVVSFLLLCSPLLSRLAIFFPHAPPPHPTPPPPKNKKTKSQLNQTHTHTHWPPTPKHTQPPTTV